MNDDEVTIFLEALRESKYNNTIMNDEESTIFWAALRKSEYPFLAPLRRESKVPDAKTSVRSYSSAERESTTIVIVFANIILITVIIAIFVILKYGL